jgi:hypothetical protein
VVKKCKFNPDIRCWHFSCDFVDGMGDIRICKYHLNPSGFFVRKKVVYLVGRRVGS